mgnify:CR=1 FL=1
MKRCLLLTFIGVSSLLQFGCGDGVASTQRERQARYKAIIDNDFRQLVDDWDYLWLMDEKTHLSRFEIE